MTTETLTPPPTETLTAAPRERTASDALLAAARYIEEHGWCQGVEQDATGRVCIIGALRSVSDGGVFTGPAARAWDRLYRRFGDEIPAHWNDELGRTEAEVLAALRAAAAVS